MLLAKDSMLPCHMLMTEFVSILAFMPATMLVIALACRVITTVLITALMSVLVVMLVASMTASIWP